MFFYWCCWFRLWHLKRRQRDNSQLKHIMIRIHPVYRVVILTLVTRLVMYVYTVNYNILITLVYILVDCLIDARRTIWLVWLTLMICDHTRKTSLHTPAHFVFFRRERTKTANSPLCHSTRQPLWHSTLQISRKLLTSPSFPEQDSGLPENITLLSLLVSFSVLKISAMTEIVSATSGFICSRDVWVV